MLLCKCKRAIIFSDLNLLILSKFARFRCFFTA